MLRVVGTVKHLEDWQILKVRRCCWRNKHQLALSCGVTLQNRKPASSRSFWATVLTARFKLGFTIGIFVGIIVQAVVLFLLRQ
jgi:hypothetical protein